MQTKRFRFSSYLGQNQEYLRPQTRITTQTQVMTNPKEARGTTQQTQVTQKPQMLQAVPKLLPSQEVLLFQKLQLVQKYQTPSQRRRGQEHRTIRTLLKNCQNHKSPEDLPTIPTILQRQDQRSQRC